MSTPAEQLVYAALSASAPLRALVAARISPLTARNKTTPYVVYQMMGAHPDQTQDGEVNVQDPHVQVDCYGDIEDYDTVRAVARAVCSALRTGSSPPQGLDFLIENDGTDMPDPNPRIARVMIEAAVWHDTLR